MRTIKIMIGASEEMHDEKLEFSKELAGNSEKEHNRAYQ